MSRLQGLRAQHLRARDARQSASGGSVVAADTARQTYRAVRLAIVGTVVALLIAVAITRPRYDEPLPTLSHYFYTPAGAIFVGTLVAASVAMIALQGGGVQQVLLDAAALLLPLVALVPANADSALLARLGQTACADADPCVPAPFDEYATTGAAVWLVTVPVALAATAVLGVIARRRGEAATGTLTPTLGICGALWAAVGVWFGAFPASFLAHAHYIAATAFFLLIALVALWQAFLGPLRGARQLTAGDPPTRFQRAAPLAYAVVAASMSIVILVGAGILIGAPSGGSGMFWVETSALILFAVFWIVQTVQKWDLLDP
ncbi:hypothetical protein AB3M83_06995 [Microbacterium sp. 179-B 1A2 NHS]|uniref:hypothetical protein n=1 Tax=Microbacterium sp. 179-B 1A2 NHS TaxID=3142383 RepID=UPI0039A3A941